jgi:vancomycin aglycone glucosyltransferase
MKVLISSIGSRGDVQPIVALALELRALGHAACLCVAPNFKEWVESFGLVHVPIGPDLKKLTGGTAPVKRVKPSKAQLQQLAVQMIRGQFQVLTDAARGCDLIIAAGALQIATRSIAEALKIPYAFAAYCPVTFPSPDHPPPKMGSHYSQTLPGMVNRFLRMRDARSWDALFLATLNEERLKVGLAPIEHAQRQIFGDRPWLAADPVIAPTPSRTGLPIAQTGAWLLSDRTALSDHLESFLANGAPPVYFGFGSMRAAERTGPLLVESARTLGLRSIVSQGWGSLSPTDSGADCISIGDVDHKKLLPRVAAVVHHGGAGTTTAAVRAGRPQVIVPHLYDQYYWASRVKKLGVGVSGPTRERLSVNAIASALRACLEPEMAHRAHALAYRVELRGAQIDAERLVKEFG